jgi:hypothetical protein
MRCSFDRTVFVEITKVVKRIPGGVAKEVFAPLVENSLTKPIEVRLPSAYSTISKKVSGFAGSKASLAHITVTRFSVSERLIILWV